MQEAALSIIAYGMNTPQRTEIIGRSIRQAHRRRPLMRTVLPPPPLVGVMYSSPFDCLFVCLFLSRKTRKVVDLNKINWGNK